VVQQILLANDAHTSTPTEIMASSAAPEAATTGEDAMAGTIERPANIEIIADEIDDDGDSSIGRDNESNTTSLASSILDYNFENGRRYHKFREGRYVFPNDDAEQDREDLNGHGIGGWRVTFCTHWRFAAESVGYWYGNMGY
jgi:hypothetical protein